MPALCKLIILYQVNVQNKDYGGWYQWHRTGNVNRENEIKKNPNTSDVKAKSYNMASVITAKGIDDHHTDNLVKNTIHGENMCLKFDFSCIS